MNGLDVVAIRIADERAVRAVLRPEPPRGNARELLEETGLRAGDLTPIDVFSGPEFVVRYPDGYAAYVVGATFETSDFTGNLEADDAGETAALAWWPEDGLPAAVNPYNRLILRRAGLDA